MSKTQQPINPSAIFRQIETLMSDVEAATASTKEKAPFRLVNRKDANLIDAYYHHLQRAYCTPSEIRQHLFQFTVKTMSYWNTDNDIADIQEHLPVLGRLYDFLTDLDRPIYPNTRYSRRQFIEEKLSQMDGFYTQRSNGDIYYYHIDTSTNKGVINLFYSAKEKSYTDDIIEEMTITELIERIHENWSQITEID